MRRLISVLGLLVAFAASPARAGSPDAPLPPLPAPTTSTPTSTPTPTSTSTSTPTPTPTAPPDNPDVTVLQPAPSLATHDAPTIDNSPPRRRQFYESGWFWGAIAAAAFAGGAVYLATRDNSAPTIHLEMQVPH